MTAKTTLLLSNRSQAVRPSRAGAFDDSVRDVMILHDGPRRIIVPADSSWDDFFDEPGVDLGKRDQPAAQDRDPF